MVGGGRTPSEEKPPKGISNGKLFSSQENRKRSEEGGKIRKERECEGEGWAAQAG